MEGLRRKARPSREQQLEQARFLCCTEMQGYLFSPPRRLEDIRRLLRPRVGKRAPIA